MGVFARNSARAQWVYVALLLAAAIVLVSGGALTHSMPAGYWAIAVARAIVLTALLARINMGISRTVSALDTHWLLSGVLGLGIGYAVVRREQSTSKRVGIAVLAAGAWLGHLAIDSPITESGYLTVLILVAIPVVAYFAAYRPAMKAEWNRFAAVAANEPEDLIAPSDTRTMRTRRTRRAARRTAGTAAVAVHRVQTAQLRLVNAILRADEADGLREDVRRARAADYPGADANT